MLTKTDVKIIKNLLQKELKPIKRDVGKIRRDLEMVAGTLDEEQVKLQRRVEHIETHLSLSPL